MWRFTMAICLQLGVIVALTGCSHEEVPVEPAEQSAERQDAGIDDDDGRRVFVGQGAQLGDALSASADGAGLLGPILTVDGGEFERVGMRFDALRTPSVAVRSSDDRGQTWTDWTEASLTFQEGDAHNAHADLRAPGSTVQVRFGGVEAKDLSFLMVEAIGESVGQDTRDRAETGDIRRTQYALAATNGVDVTRAQWGASGHSCGVSHGPYRVTIHHTVTPNNDSASMPQRVRQIQSYHRNTRGWCDIGYHFLVGQDGKVYQGRPEGLRGTHVGGHNHGNLGVSFIGTYTSTAPSSAMMNAGARILSAISGYYGIGLNRTDVRGHREYNSTGCPGGALYGQLGHLVNLASNTSGGTDPQGCTPTEANNCGAYGCGCVDGECAGGFCPGSGCTDEQESNCAAFGCGCVDGECSGGFCPGSGCTAKQITDCGNFGCHCVDGECAGGFCEGNGCTAKQTSDCSNFGCQCVDGVCAGGFCPGSGCTAKQALECEDQGCGCVDGQCAGGDCAGAGCTAKQTNDCSNFGCECDLGECSGGFCSDDECESGQLDCGAGVCADSDGCCEEADCSGDQRCVGYACVSDGDLGAGMKISPSTLIYPNVPEPDYGGTEVSFEDASSGDVDSRAWSFEDADPADATDEVVRVRFQSAGAKQVSLEVCDASGTCDATTSDVEVLDPAPEIGEVHADQLTAAVCVPVAFSVDGVAGYPTPALSWEIVEAQSDAIVADGPAVQSGSWDTLEMEPGEYYARAIAENESGQAQAEGPTVTLHDLADGDPLPPECEDGEGHADAGPSTGDAGIGDGGQAAEDTGQGSSSRGATHTAGGEACGGCAAGGSTAPVSWLFLFVCVFGLRRSRSWLSAIREGLAENR